MRRLLDDPLVHWIATLLGIFVLVLFCVAIAVIGGMWLREAR